MSTSASLRLASRRPASTPFVASPRLAAAMWTQPTSKLRTTSFPTQRTTDGDNTMLDELDSVRPPALPATETVLLECRPLRRGRPGARSALFSSLRHLRPFGEPARCCRRIRRRLQPSLPHCLLPPASSLPTAGFGWQSWEGNRWWRQLRAQVPALAAAGITHLWLPPPSASVSAQGYLPGQLSDLNSKYGTAQELRDLCSDLLRAGIRWMLARAGGCRWVLVGGRTGGR